MMMMIKNMKIMMMIIKNMKIMMIIIKNTKIMMMIIIINYKDYDDNNNNKLQRL
jgi:hypothetical protein